MSGPIGFSHALFDQLTRAGMPRRKAHKNPQPAHQDLVKALSSLLNKGQGPKKGQAGSGSRQKRHENALQYPLAQPGDLRRMLKPTSAPMVRSALLSAFNSGGGILVGDADGKVTFTCDIQVPPRFIHQPKQPSE
ncbi:nucleocapsid protein N [African pouched rat arterivirus]|uniref:Nucleoprotein n=1 Tax=African pouched rat arterivirus TaxID=1965064 RepID=A0A0B5JFS1_9NIDO|nr:nucleocapsid protein N [African pouched rat arterivirus]AJG06166.1 nucleocapsid protein N [African pouched rat arterivirus]